MAKKKEPFPEDCCGACKFSHNVEGLLECYGSPPMAVIDDAMQIVYVRSILVLPEDPVCHIFINRQHS